MKRLLTLSLILISAISYAFDINPKFGSVSMDELTMDSYAKDTSAVAVYLYSNETIETDIEPSGFTTYTIVRRRIKVLKDEGKSFADFSITWNKKDGEHVKGIKVTTYNIVNGKVKATKMSRKYIFEQNVTGGLYSTKFSAQDVMVGSVIEVEYSTESPDFWSFPDIHLQKSIPIISGQANVIYPEYFRYQKYQRGTNKAVYDHKIETKILGQIVYREVIDSYTMTDMPASATESDHCWCPPFYADAVVYELNSINFPGVLNKTFNKDWSKVDEAFAETEMFASMMRKVPLLKSELDALAPDLKDASDEKVISAVRDLVRSKIAWNNERSFKVDIPEALKKGTGNDSEMNCLLGSSLAYLGYIVSPTMLLQKNHGVLISFHISTNSFSKMILQIRKGSKTWYMDASDPYGALNCLSPICLVEEARVVHKGAPGAWANLSKLVRSMEYVSVDGTVGEDGEFTYNISQDMTNHDAWTFRKLFGKDRDEEKRVELLESVLGSEIEEIEFTGLDEWVSTVSFKAKASRMFESYDGTIYINPFIRAFQEAGAFEATERTLPVEFDFPESVTYNVTIHIPEGYEIVEMPKNTYAVMKVIDSFVRTSYTAINDQTIRVSYQYKLNNVTCLVDDYSNLRDYWLILSNVYKDRIVIRKK